jgi:hypothetical protein
MSHLHYPPENQTPGNPVGHAQVALTQPPGGAPIGGDGHLVFRSPHHIGVFLFRKRRVQGERHSFRHLSPIRLLAEWRECQYR